MEIGLRNAMILKILEYSNEIITYRFIVLCWLSISCFLIILLAITFLSEWFYSCRESLSYRLRNGPHEWRHEYMSARGCYQSPININTNETQTLLISEPLKWNFYDNYPNEVILENTGHTISLRAYFPGNQPHLCGADLLESYSIVSICFRWSLDDSEGSEHSIDDRKYPLELQATHLSQKATTSKQRCANDLGLLVVSYFFMATKCDNPYLDPIILNLHSVRKPFQKAQINPFPLAWLCYPFSTGFYSYGGSFTQPPCSEGVTWFIYPHPLSVSFKQLAEFQTILCEDSIPLLKNSRPVQKLNSRIVCYNHYEPVPRETYPSTETFI